LAALAAVEVGLRPFFPWHIPNLFWDWASVAAYVICFVWGAWAAHRPELEAALRRMLPLTAMVALAGLWLYVVRPDGWPLVGIGRALWLWAVLATVIGAGAWIGSGRIPGERYLAEAALPIYVLHHVPLVAIGYVVKDQPWPISQRYGLIVAGALAVTLAVYHLLVRPFDPVRLAFGMSRRR
jgi:peptidoglycan/LPS O-acetylase OafA/YrhL